MAERKILKENHEGTRSVSFMAGYPRYKVTCCYPSRVNAQIPRTKMATETRRHGVSLNSFGMSYELYFTHHGIYVLSMKREHEGT
jgi:hypothetical protein